MADSKRMGSGVGDLDLLVTYLGSERKMLATEDPTLR